MKDGVLGQLALTFASLSLVAVGGATATAPAVQTAVVDHLHWLTRREFAEAFAIAQTAPGPNVMLASLIGWQVAGVTGLLVATLAMNGPSAVLAFGVGRAWRRWAQTPWLKRAQEVIAPIAAGLILASGVTMSRTADHTVVAVIVSAAVGAFVMFTKRNPLWALAVAALVGVIAARLGPPL
jgi:chromate transporter